MPERKLNRIPLKDTVLGEAVIDMMAEKGVTVDPDSLKITDMHLSLSNGKQIVTGWQPLGDTLSLGGTSCP